MSAAPNESWTVTNFYKQSVYDPNESKIGDVDDVLVDKSGKVTGFVIGVGGFLGAGEKDVIVPFTAVKTSKKNDKWWLTLAAGGNVRLRGVRRGLWPCQPQRAGLIATGRGVVWQSKSGMTTGRSSKSNLRSRSGGKGTSDQGSAGCRPDAEPAPSLYR